MTGSYFPENKLLMTATIQFAALPAGLTFNTAAPEVLARDELDSYKSHNFASDLPF